MNTDKKYFAVCPSTGIYLSIATNAERLAYLAQPTPPAFRKAILAGNILVDENTGPAIDHRDGNLWD